VAFGSHKSKRTEKQILFVSGPPTHPNVLKSIPRPFANGGMQPVPIPVPRPTPPLPPPQFLLHPQSFGGPRPPPPQAMGIHQHGWAPQHMQQGGPPPPQQPMHHHHHMSMPPPPTARP
ncbi:hypothetical protein BRARA_F02493, partial [Brassica rapa]